MKRIPDSEIIGKKFGRLTVLHFVKYYFTPSGQRRDRIFCCLCECGNIFETRYGSIKNGLTISCGCAKIIAGEKRKTQNIIGRRVGRLIVMQEVEGRITPCGTKQRMFDCLCDCGNHTVIRLGAIQNVSIRSCGCLMLEIAGDASRTHGFANKIPEYGIWKGIRTRCYNTNDQAYFRYGGRGIIMCQEWYDDFMNFYKDMGSRPSPKHTIDRRDGNKGYSPDNCRWATRKEQSNNLKTNVNVTHNGKTQSVSMWEQEIGFNNGIISWRLRHGWSVADAITIPLKHARKKNQFLGEGSPNAVRTDHQKPVRHDL